MNFALSDEQVLLREAARGALSRFKTIEAAREALEDPRALPDLWPTAVEAGWPGLLVGEEHGGAGLGAFDALLVAEECGRVLAAVPLLGLLPASAILDAAGDESLTRSPPASCGRRTCPRARPATASRAGRSSRRPGSRGRRRPGRTVDGDEVTLEGTVAFVPDAPGADLLVVVAADRGRRAGGRRGADRRPTASRWSRWSATTRPGRSAHVSFSGARGRRLDVGDEVLADAWYLAQALIAAESIGAVQTCLDVSVAYAKERFTFGRAIGSYQAVKHELTEVLRRLENSRGLQYYAGWARASAPEEFALAASAARSAAGGALDFAARAMINVHGGSAPRGSTTRRCSSAARSSPAGCSAGPTTPPTGCERRCAPRRPPRSLRLVGPALGVNRIHYDVNRIHPTVPRRPRGHDRSR